MGLPVGAGTGFSCPLMSWNTALLGSRICENLHQNCAVLPPQLRMQALLSYTGMSNLKLPTADGGTSQSP